jgi:phosphosulfolactate synthase (CoM biosynthesis protein A)
MYANITAPQGNSGTVTIVDSGVEVSRLNKYGQTDSLVTMVDLEKDVFKVPIETLINIWVTRFGNEWVDLETIDEDDFFINAYKRLKQLGHLEQHYLTDRSRYVCRKPE